MTIFYIGERVQTAQSISSANNRGTVVKRFGPPFTDGSHGLPKPGDVFVQWDDGTKGFWQPSELMREVSRSSLLG